MKRKARTVLVFGKDPCKSDLAGRCIVLVRNCFDLFGQSQVLWEILFAESRQAQSEVTLIKISAGLESS